MIQVSMEEAMADLDGLLNKATQGNEFVIVGADGSSFQLMALPRVPKPLFGSAKGFVQILPGFDEPIEGFEDCLP